MRSMARFVRRCRWTILRYLLFVVVILLLASIIIGVDMPASPPTGGPGYGVDF